MMTMKLQMKTGPGGGEEPAQDQPWSGSPLSPPPLDKETVFEWFGLQLSPAQRIEFMCGLLHMCQPLELRFLGSYLEDLARKDFFVLRDFECRANSPADLVPLTDPLDPVVRAKLLVYLSLLQSDNRECAGIMFHILSHVDPVLFYLQPGSSCGPCPGVLDQLALLFTMASVHPAFHFHQREAVRDQLEQILLVLERHRQNPQVLTEELKVQTSPSADLGDSHTHCQSLHSSSRTTPQREAVHIETIVLQSISRSRIEKEYSFEVKWSDSTSSNVTKTHSDLENFLLKLPKDQCTESFQRSIVSLLNQREMFDGWDGETNIRERFLAAPTPFRTSRGVCRFFSCDSQPARSRCICQPVQAYNGDCSDASSQEEDTYVQEQKKKPVSRSPCQPGQKEPRYPTAERMRKSCSQQGAQHVDSEKKSLTGVRGRSRAPPTDRDKAKSKGAALVINGATSQKKVGASGPDTFGESSSESYSLPSSPQHGAGSVDSDDNIRDTDSHSTACVKAPDSTGSSPQEHVLVMVDVSSHQDQIKPLFGPQPFSPSLLYSTADSGLREAPPPSISSTPDDTPSMPMMMPPVPPVLPIPRVVRDLEKRESFPTFGLPRHGLPHPVSPGVQPVVQRFKTLSTNHSPGGRGDGAPAAPHSSIIRGFQGPPRSLQPCPDSGVLEGPPAYSLPQAPPPAPPSPEPSADSSTGQSECPSTGSPPAPLQHAQQQAGGCGACGCHNNCGSVASVCHAAPFFPPQHMSTASCQMFSVPPPLFQLTSLCSNSYLTHTPPPPPAPTFFPSAPPTYLHTHAQCQTEVTPHMVASYSLQQQLGLAHSVYQHVYPNPLGRLLAAAAASGKGGVNKKNGSVSCCNCGGSGHYVQDCNQPAIDSKQQGGFHLKYIVSHFSESLENTD
ncbi:zinc finger CCHC domain-containing protein 2 isoform X2 [Gouania willdenowi]|uniref:zinc finger CCHC domain-containing protein 2 isoform X2 n=1 Tax=Gouania willdenowi TaxID=441366 RepID=UPI001054853E|nr:zinc finger CCHC domain-containing protein 2 isoform X2 [Gouania willdenowi]